MFHFLTTANYFVFNYFLLAQKKVAKKTFAATAIFALSVSQK